MGLIRKTMSLGTLGAIDFKSDKERIATYTKKAAKEAERANDIAERAKASAEQGSRLAAFQAKAAEMAAQISAEAEPVPQVSAPQVPAPQVPAPQGPPPGWYDDTQDPARQRWWDGTRWTEHTQARA